MSTFYSQFDTVEEYRFSFGRYRGKTLSEIVDKEDCLEYLKWVRKKLKQVIKNPKYPKYTGYNIRGLKEVENYLLQQGHSIELTDYDRISDVTGNTSENIEQTQVKEEEETPIINKEITNNTITEMSFKELNNLFTEKIVSSFDEKFQSKKYIRNEYRDYLCLRYTRKTYFEILQDQDVVSLEIILQNLS